MPRTSMRLGLAAVALVGLSACDDQGFDFDLRDQFSEAAFDTTSAARSAVAERPTPDDRGVISYPSYQVAVARRGDTVVNVAGRVGLPPEELARYNGLPMEAVLRRGEIVALPRRVAEPSPATGSPTTGPIVAPADAPQALAAATAQVSTVDVQTLAGEAIDRAAAAPKPAAAPAPAPAPRIATGQEPVRHKVVTGETAYSIARRYSVPVKALADWNGLGADYSVREGQYLLIPVAEAAPPAPAAADESSRPGQGTLAPVPPSAAQPLPSPDDAKPDTAATLTPASPDMASQTTAAAASGARMIYPVSGKIARAYQKGKNDGIDIAAAPGTPVLAADSGVVAAITRDVDQVPILVLRHADNVLTVYAGVDQIAVNKGDQVRRGQEIAKVRDKEPALLHFEVREGFESVDPALYLE